MHVKDGTGMSGHHVEVLAVVKSIPEEDLSIKAGCSQKASVGMEFSAENLSLVSCEQHDGRLKA